MRGLRKRKDEEEGQAEVREIRARAVNIRAERCDVYVGRPTKWGNPFPLPVKANLEQRAEVVGAYREYLRMNEQLVLDARRELRGRTLGCFCKPKECHADVLAEVAEGADP